MAVPRRLSSDPVPLFQIIVVLAVVVFGASMAYVAPTFAALSAGALLGAIAGYVVFLVRARRGLGASLTAERDPEYPGTINAAHIPVSGIGGLGFVAAAAVVAMVLPAGQALLAYGAIGGVLGASAMIVWRRVHNTSPFVDHPEETLHLR